MVFKTEEVKRRNAEFPRYGECARCGGNWGWKEPVDHAIDATQSVFLFCEECDVLVTVEERWKALDFWKIEAIRGLCTIVHIPQFTLPEVRRLLDAQFVKYPKGH